MLNLHRRVGGQNTTPGNILCTLLSSFTFQSLFIYRYKSLVRFSIQTLILCLGYLCHDLKNDTVVGTSGIKQAYKCYMGRKITDICSAIQWNNAYLCPYRYGGQSGIMLTFVLAFMEKLNMEELHSDTQM